MDGLLASQPAQQRPGFWRGLLDAFGQDAAAARDWFVNNVQRASGGGILSEGETDAGARARAGMALGALGMTGAAPGGVFAAPRGAVMGAGPIRAYHGSPHDFDRFDINKIGTGEGAQAYGHGLYFAENEGVARSYRDALTNNSPATRVLVNGKPLIEMVRNNADAGAIGRLLERNDLDPAKAAKAIGYGEQRYKPIFDSLTGKEISVKEPGRMYEVAIHADPERFLDWDKPLAQQAPAVRDAVMSSYGDVRPVRLNNGRYAVTIVKGDQAGRIMYAVDEPTADAAMAAFREKLPQQATGSDAYMDLNRFVDRNAAVASDALRDAGIPGIRYLDAGSRGAGDGSRNYVVFDDKLVEILRKYGLLGPAVLGGGLLASQDSEAAPR